MEVQNKIKEIAKRKFEPLLSDESEIGSSPDLNPAKRIVKRHGTLITEES